MEISVNLRNGCSDNQLNYNNDLSAIENKNCALQKLSRQIFWHSNRQRETAIVICHLLNSPKHALLHSNIFCDVKLFATIMLSWNLLQCILWYLLEFSDPFLENENSVWPILRGHTHLKGKKRGKSNNFFWPNE